MIHPKRLFRGWSEMVALLLRATTFFLGFRPRDSGMGISSTAKPKGEHATTTAEDAKRYHRQLVMAEDSNRCYS